MGAVSILSFWTVPTASAQLLFGHGYSSWSATAAGSYVFEADGSYDHLSGVVAGQQQSLNQPFSFYRGYVVFDLPSFRGVVTPAQIGISPNDVDPPVTQLKVKVTSAVLQIPNIGLHQSWFIDLPVDIRLSSVPVAPLLAGTIDPATAYQEIGSGTILAHETLSPSGNPGDNGYAFELSPAFADLLNKTDVGSVVLSFRMPFIHDSRRDNVELLGFDPAMTLVTWFDGYDAATVFTPVPEPSTYVLGGAFICAATAAWRRLRSRQPV